MDTASPVLACSKCSALYTAAAGDRGLCIECRRRAPAPQPPMQPLRKVTTSPISTRPTPTDTRRPNFAKRRNWHRRRIAVPVAIAAAVALLVTQRQRLSDAWESLQRQDVKAPLAAAEQKASAVWTDVRAKLPLLNSETKTTAPATPTRNTTATRGTNHRAELAAGSPKRKSKTRQRSDSASSSTTR